MNLNNREVYPEVCIQLLATLKVNLPTHLTYHSLYHTIDVANVCNMYIEHYKIDDEYAKLLRIASVGHDFGYIISPENHEERSIQALSQILSNILNPKEITLVNAMIRATKVPQAPKSFYDKILADADLDYLGRPDYDELSDCLFKEFQYYHIVKTEEQWLNLQIQFLENHSYHTTFAQAHRKPQKLKKLKELKEKRSVFGQ